MKASAACSGVMEQSRESTGTDYLLRKCMGYLSKQGFIGKKGGSLLRS